MLDTTVKYSYNDVTIVPAVESSVIHRKDCDPFLDDGKLPIFTAPMSTVIDEKNFNYFNSNSITAILPRNIDFDIRINFLQKKYWVALSLNEFILLFNTENKSETWDKCEKIYVLIDIANGHMKLLYESVLKAKQLYQDKLCIMVGNIANPETYITAYEHGVDYIRVGIGSGNGCITSSNVGIHYPMASLVTETFLIKQKLATEKNVDINQLPKIVADGGIRNYNDVIKALALGADYVMIGSLFASIIESAALVAYKLDNKFVDLNSVTCIHQTDIDFKVTLSNGKVIVTDKLYKKFYGMASKNGQIDLCGEKNKTSEGISKYIEVTTYLHKWIKNMEDYIRSAMSYLNITNIKDINQAHVIVVSNNTYNSINK